MVRTFCLFGLCVMAASACSVGGGDGTEEQVQMTASDFAEPESDGTLPIDFMDSPSPRTYEMSDIEGDGISYALGYIEGVGFAAYSGVLPASDVQAPPTTGTIVYDAHYVLSAVVNIHEENGGLIGIFGVGGSEDITLTADFIENSLTGETDYLSVDGILAGNGETGLSGTVTYLGIDGELTGLIGSDEVVGAFHGHSDDMVYAGGFIGEAN